MLGLPRPSILGNLRFNKEVPMNKKYIVRLTDEERAICEATIKKETGKSEKLRRARILLKDDADGPAWDDTKIRQALGLRGPTGVNGGKGSVLACLLRGLVTKQMGIAQTPKW